MIKRNTPKAISITPKEEFLKKNKCRGSLNSKTPVLFAGAGEANSPSGSI